MNSDTSMPSPESVHISVLLNEAVDALAPKAGGRYLDGTVGMGGHSFAIMERTGGEGFLCGLDRDTQALELARIRLAPFGDRVHLVHTRYSEFEAALDGIGWDAVDGALIDIGVSSLQIDSAERGFSFSSDGPLDMRMDSSEGQTALDLINSLSEIELAKIFREYAEIPNFSKLARAVKAAADAGKISTTRDLAETVEKVSPSTPRGKIHPATLVFQALRIAVNDELGEIERALPEAFELLGKGGVLAAISFHSLEDRIVKKFFKKMAGRPEDRHDHSSVQDRIKLATILTRKPVLPSEGETAENPRSRSAKLRAIKKD